MTGQRAIPPVAALRAFATGGPVVLADDRSGADPAILIAAAQLVRAETMAFVVRHGSGFVTVALPNWRCDELDLPALAADPRYRSRPVAAVAVDAAQHITTGISATDRSHTARLLADPDTRIDQLTRPGHLVPLRVPERVDGAITSSAAAGLALCELAGLALAVVCCELVHDAGELLSPDQSAAFARVHQLPMISVATIECCARELLCSAQIA